MKKILISIKVLIGITILSYGIKLILNIPFNQIEAQLTDLPFPYILFSITCFIIAHSLRIFRIKWISQKHELSNKKLLFTEFLTTGINLLIPFRLGEAYRIYEYNKYIKKAGKTISIIATERLCDAIIIFTFALISFQTLPLNKKFEAIITLTLLSCLAGIISLIIISKKIENLIDQYQKKHPQNKILPFFKDIFEQFEELKKINPKQITKILALSSLIWICDISAFYYIQYFVSSKITFIQCGLTTFLFSILPAGPVGTGNIQVAFKLIANAQKNPQIVSLSLIYQIMILIPITLNSIALFMFQKIADSLKLKASPNKLDN